MLITPIRTTPLAPLDAPREAGAEAVGTVVRVVDLFAGCGGLSLGLQQAAERAGIDLDIALAIDFEAEATSVYKTNFPDANVVTDSVESYFDGKLGAPLSDIEAQTKAKVGAISALVGGPPCQGHSNLNNSTRRHDPKNELYLRMARAAEVLRPDIVLIENVPSVRLDTANVVQVTFDHLELLGYTVHTRTVGLHALGVAQTRQRHVLLAALDREIDVEAVLDEIGTRTADPLCNLRWAIGDLERIDDRAGYDVAPVASAINIERMQYLLDKDEYDLPNDRRPVCHQGNHSYKSMYGRLNWDLPAQTITSGFGSIGQGRYMHPAQRRALTAHEAARIQGFPDYFRFEPVTRRSVLATMIGNAVPPALTRELFEELLGRMSLPASAPINLLVPLRPEPALLLA